jgi:hypothetical protein
MPPLSNIVEETKRVITEANKRGVVLRLFGGMAIRFHAPSATHRSLERKYADIDFMALKKQSKQIRQLFADLGYSTRDVFNALQGDRRLIFQDIENGRRVDIFLNIFEMCHTFDFSDRLTIDPETISLADLLLTKLQVVEMTSREYRDIVALVHDHEIGDDDAPETINGKYLAHLCADQWGVYKTLTTNIDNVIGHMDELTLGDKDREIVRKRLEDLRNRFDSVPKTIRWKARARVGERVQWYELPEQDKEIVVQEPGRSQESKST